jgi:outer membrane beta-barrel protein
MRRAALALSATLAFAGTAMAQDKEAAPPGEEAAPPPAAGAEEPAAEPPAAEAPKEGADAKTPIEEVKPGTKNWSDIFVVPRRAVLKRRRLEFMPTWNVTLNNPVIRHHGLGGALNLYLSETFFIGLEGTWYTHEPLTGGRYFLLGSQQRVIPSVNEYLWSAMLNFGYIPIHGKFTFFNSTIFHWETYISLGVGVLQSKVVPRDPSNEPFQNFDIAVAPAVGGRMWLTRWLAIDGYLKCYAFPDKLEPTDRKPGESATDAQNRGETTAVFDFVFGMGVSLMIPPGFEYKTLR